MESERIRINTLLAATAIIVILEIGARLVHPATPTLALTVTGAARLVTIWLLIFLTWKMQSSLAAIGLGPAAYWTGLLRGVVWSLAFGGLVILGFGGLYLAGINPLMLFRVPLPEFSLATLLYFIVGVVLAPVAEEIYFRGLIYGYLRRWGIVVATLGSTLLFVAAHPGIQQVPVPQIAGGILFAAAYEVEKKLLVPIVIHATGNLALFSLSLIG